MTSMIELRGELYLSVEAVAECYRVEARWIEEVHRSGLVRAERVEGRLALPERELDRLAAVLRWHRHHGLALETVLALLDG